MTYRKLFSDVIIRKFLWKTISARNEESVQKICFLCQRYENNRLP